MSHRKCISQDSECEASSFARASKRTGFLLPSYGWPIWRKVEREAAEVREVASKGRMTFGDALAIFKAQTEASHLLKPSAKHYRMEVITAILKSWPGIGACDVRKITEGECKTWAAKFSGKYSATRYDAAIGVLRAIFNAAIEVGDRVKYRPPRTSRRDQDGHAAA